MHPNKMWCNPNWETPPQRQRKKDVANLLGHCKDSKFTSLFQGNNNIFAPIIGNSYCKGLLTYYVQQITLNNRFSILIE